MNSLGRKFRVSIFGESHGDAIGFVLDGVQPGIALRKEDFMPDILRRKSGALGTTPRTEADEPELLSGVFNGYTTGAPLTIIFRNRNTRSGDYKLFNDIPRPGHADYTASIKWMEFNDPRGGGHFSGRLTLPIVAAGVVAKKMVNYQIKARLVEVGGVRREVAAAQEHMTDMAEEQDNPAKDSQIWRSVLEAAIRDRDSVGGIVECAAIGLPAGLGDPMFDGMENRLASALFGIPAVKGVEFGAGFGASRLRGSENNDAFRVEDGRIVTETNHAGGILGGITTGMPLTLRVGIKPTPSIGRPQKTVSLARMENTELTIRGRHDPCIAHRAVPVVEAVTACVLLDLLLEEHHGTF